MAHTSFYRTYRPATFADMVGQKHIERTLRNAVATDQVAHAYLFSGPRGTGKTTTARILAAALLCEHPKDGEPDGSCAQCQDVANGTHPDVMELDAASRTGVDNMRDEVIARAQYTPVRGRSKVYIIDEVHMLSTGASNAFLKTLEEPPEHVVFILCTTDPQKVPETVRSRCQQFEFRPYTVEELSEQLQRIGEAEGIKAEPAALTLIAARARGGMRDAITSYEQLAAFTDNHITVAAVESTLGGADAASLAELVRIVATADTPASFRWVAAQVSKGADLPEVISALIGYVRDLYVLQVIGTAPGIIDRSDDELARMKELLSRLSGPEQIARMLDLLAELSVALRWANEPRTLIELALVRLTRPESDLSLEALSQRIEALEAGGGTVPVASTGTVPLSPSEPSPLAPTGTVPSDAGRLWREVLDQIRQTARSRYALFVEAELEPDAKGGYVLSFAPSAAFALKAAKESDNVALLRAAFEQVSGQAPSLRFVLRGEQPLPDMPAPEVTVNDVFEPEDLPADDPEDPLVEPEYEDPGYDPPAPAPAPAPDPIPAPSLHPTPPVATPAAGPSKDAQAIFADLGALPVVEQPQTIAEDDAQRPDLAQEQEQEATLLDHDSLAGFDSPE